MEDIQRELNEAWEELQSLTKETKKISKDQRKKQPHFSKEKSTSSWAMSKTSRSSIPLQNQNRASSPELFPNTGRSSTPKSGFTISKSIKRSIFDSGAAASKEEFYDPNQDVLSSQKRSRSAIISKSDRNLSIQQEVSSHATPQSEGPVERKEPVRTFSFSKAKRDKELIKEGPSQSHLNVDSADKLIRERPQSAIFPKGKRGIDETQHPNESDVGPQTPKSRSTKTNIEVLSNRVSSNTGGKIAPPQRSHSRKRSVVDNSDYGNPGPGAYTDSIAKLYSISSSTKSKGIKFSPSPATERVKSFQKQKLISEVKAPGPGAYDVEAAETHTRQRVPGFSNIFRPESAETKNTPQLQRKKYWEEKARDAREDPEDRRESSFEFGTKRTPTVTIRPDVRKGIDYKNREIIRKIRAEKMREASIGYYDKKYDFVELQPPAPVRMEQQVKSEANTKAMLDLAGITPASQRRALEIAKRDYYLGPQLQIPWEEDRLNLNAQIARDDSGEESPTEEVLRLIRKRNNQEDDVPINDTTNAYLKSLGSKPATIRMREPTRSDVRKVFDGDLDLEAQNRDYLPTQLHHEWGEIGNGDYHGKALQMDVVASRDTKRVLHKGVIETILFHEAPRMRPGDYAPGDYDVDGGKRFGEKVKGAMVDFNRFVSRSDLVGPNGERPENEVDYELGDFSREEVIVDATHAKERILKHTEAPKLYVKDRHERPKTPEPGLTQLGGEWFQGMASEKKKSALVNYDLMPDRGLTESERLEEEDDMAPGDELMLEVKDWKPNKVLSEPGGPAWMDPKKDPRFGKEKKGDYTGEDEPRDLNYDYLNPREGLHVLDMKNLPARWVDESDEDNLIQGEVYGGEVGVQRRRRDLEDAADEDEQIRIGEEMQSSKKRSANFVNMKQQTSHQVNLHISDAPVDAQYDVKEMGKERRDVGVVSWDRVSGREMKIISKEKVQFNETDRGSDEEEVAISPKTTNLSTSKRPITAPAWSLQKGKKHVDPPEPLGNHLHYDTDTEFGNELKGGANYSKDRGRKDDELQLHEFAGEEYAEEELELEPNYDLLKQIKGEKSSLGSVPWAKRSDLKDRSSEKRSEAMRELDGVPQGQVLDLDIPPAINWNEKSKRGRFAKASVEENQKGYSEISKELRDQKEELILEPWEGRNKERQNSQAQWNKQSEKLDQRDHSLLEADEELILSPQRPKTQSNAIPNWRKQSSHNNPAALSLSNSMAEELILSPQLPSTQRGGSAWNKQNTDDRQLQQEPSSISKEELILSPHRKASSRLGGGKFRLTAPAQGEDLLEDPEREELILEPHRKVPSRSGGKFHQAESVLGADQDDPEKEELILEPHRQTSSRSRGGKFRAQEEREYDDPEREELMLEPHRQTPSRSGGKFRQAESVHDGDPEAEELMLSPHDPAVNKPKSGPGWNSQELESALGRSSNEKEELILSPKRPREGNKMTSWAKQSAVTAQDVDDLQRRSGEELILSPHSKSRTKGGVMLREEHRDLAKEKEREREKMKREADEELILFPTDPPLNSASKAAQKNKSTKPRSASSKTNLLPQPSDGREKEERKAPIAKKVSFESTPAVSKPKPDTQQQQQQQQSSRAMPNSSKTESKAKQKFQSQSSSTAKAKADRTTAAGGGGENQNPKAVPTLTPPRVQPLTPSDTAVPYSFQRRSSKDEMEFLDSKLKELGIDP